MHIKNEQRKWTLETESSGGKDTVKITEEIRMDLECHMTLVNKTAVRF